MRTIRKDVIDMTGRVYGRLTVLGLESIMDGGVDRIWTCKCECGSIISARGLFLRRNHKMSCGCLRRERMSNLRKKNTGEAARNSTFFRYRAGAKRRDIPFDLSMNEFLGIIDKPCHYCGSAPSNISKSEHNNGDYIYNGVDRVDNTKGYTVENCVPCCIVCNRAKNNLSYDEFTGWISNLVKHNT